MGRRLLIIIGLSLGALYLCAPTFIYFAMPKADRQDEAKVEKAIPDFFPQDHVKLGLDLQGGVQLVLGVNTDGAVDNKLSRIGTELTRWSQDNNKKVKTAYVLKGQQKLRVELEDGADTGDFKADFKEEYPGLVQVERNGQTMDFTYSDTQMGGIKKGAVEQAERVIRSRVDKWGVSEPIINRRADNSVLVQLPGFSDPDKAKELLGKTAQLKFKIVDDEFKGFESVRALAPEGVEVGGGAGSQLQFTGPSKEQIIEFTKGKVPEDRELLFEESRIAGGTKFQYTSYVVKASTEISGEDVLDAWVSRDTASLDQSPAVSLKFTGPGGKRFADVTGANVQKRMAIVLDDLVVSAPVIQQKISGGQAQINLGAGNYNEQFEEASQLSLILKSGALPATIEVLEERQVGASLGPELQQKGIYAILLGLMLVLFFMVAYYRRPGLVACLALTMNGIFLLALMAGFGSALTLPGIAGFILTLGMAVDANVLINERIRQELREGRNARKAVENGFQKVFWTIVDANVTTLIAALVLFETNSSGPIRGFAITLMIGLTVSMFTSLYCTRGLFDFFLSGKTSDSAIRDWFGGDAINRQVKLDLDFLNYGKAFTTVGVLVALSVIGVGVVRGGMNWSVDFAGGTEMEVAFGQDVPPEQIREVASEAGIKGLILQALEGGSSKYLLRFDKGDESKEAQTHSGDVATLIKTKLKDANPDILRVDFVGPQIGNELRNQGFLSILFALIGVLVYIFMRFDLRFGPGAIVKMVQDVFVMLAFYIFFWRSFDLTSVAALLTVVGYSVNDTIVIYDRIRENLVLHPKRLLRENINFSINETLSRTINTSITTLIALIGILVFGTAQIWNFAAAMAIGVVAATLSSTFLASSFVLWLEEYKKSSKRKAATA